MPPSRLEIFDFDWTLFRSPFPPPKESERWWDTPDSLLPPFIPHRPEDKFWINEVVQEMKDAQKRRDTITVVITGRREGTAIRVRRLLQQKRLSPDFVSFRSKDYRKDKDIINYKRKFIIDVLNIYPSVKEIVLWDDLQEQIDNMRDLAKRRKIDFAGHLITEIENVRCGR